MNRHRSRFTIWHKSWLKAVNATQINDTLLMLMTDDLSAYFSQIRS